MKQSTIGKELEIKSGRKVARTSGDNLCPVYGSAGRTEVTSGSILVDKGCLVIGKKGKVGSVYLTGEPSWVSSTAYYVDNFNGHSPKYWYYLLKSLKLERLARGLGVLNLDRQDLESFAVSIPPKDQQEAIARHIDRNLSKVTVSRENLKSVQETVEQLRFSLLANNFNQEWEWVELGDLVERLEVGNRIASLQEESVVEGKVGMAKVGIVTPRGLDFSKTQTLPDQSKADPQLFIRPGDFLISMANTIKRVGACAIAEEVPYQVQISSKLVRLHLKETVNKHYLNYYLQSKFGRWEIESRTIGTQSLRHLSKATLLRVKVLLPPLEEQEKVTNRLLQSFGIYDRIAQDCDQLAEDLIVLEKSLLTKSFAGTSGKCSIPT